MLFSNKMYALEFEIKGLPTLVNKMSRAHWAVAYREAKKWKGWVALICRSRRPQSPLKRARLEFTRFSHGRGVDCDNLAISFKAIRDGLIESGIIENDAPHNVEVSYGWKKVGMKEGKIKVIVHELPSL